MGEMSKQLAELAAYWNGVEERIKATEQLRSETVIPAINELRYAGRMFVEAWAIQQNGAATDTDTESFEEKIVIARQYLVNADHDAIDAALVYVYRNVKYAVKRYQPSKIQAYIPDFLTMLDKIEIFEAKIRESRKNRDLRNQIYREIIPHYNEMIALNIQLDRAERHVLRREKIATYVTRALAGLGVVGSIASIVGIALGWHSIMAFIAS